MRSEQRIGGLAPVVVLAALLASPVVLGAQLSAATPGSRVRATAPAMYPRAIVGTLLSPITDTVVITATTRGSRSNPAMVTQHQIPVSSLERLEVSQGRTRSPGTRIGLVVGGVAAAVLTIGCLVTEFGGELSEWPIPITVIACAFLTAIGTLPAVAVGALFGALVATEKWLQVYPLPANRARESP